MATAAAAAAAAVNNAAGTFMFHPRPTVFEHPITYDLPTISSLPSTIHKSYDADDLSQYYISELSILTHFCFLFFFLSHWLISSN